MRRKPMYHRVRKGARTMSKTNPEKRVTNEQINAILDELKNVAEQNPEELIPTIERIQERISAGR